MEDLKIHWPKNAVAIEFLTKFDYTQKKKFFCYDFICFDEIEARDVFYKKIENKYLKDAIFMAIGESFKVRGKLLIRKRIPKEYYGFLDMLFRMRGCPSFIIAPKELSRKLDKILEE